MFNFLKQSPKANTPSDTILIVGLGNIGSEYENTRHNIGFQIVDQLADGPWQNQQKCHSLTQKMSYEGQDAMLAKPTTMMNLSGNAVGRLAQYYKVAPENIWIIYDELDLPLGRIKISTNSSNNGHNGTISIQRQLGHNRFWRFRVGIDARQHREIPGRAYVLQQFDQSQQVLVQKSVDQASSAIKAALKQDLQTAMQEYNKATANDSSA